MFIVFLMLSAFQTERWFFEPNERRITFTAASIITFDSRFIAGVGGRHAPVVNSDSAWESERYLWRKWRVYDHRDDC